MKNILFVIGLLLMCNSCNSKKDDIDLNYIAKSVENLVIPMRNCYKNIIILPGTGCSGCISEGESFLAENYNKEDYLFVLININSLKELSHKTGVDVTKYSNIYIDDADLFLNRNRVIYPLVTFYNCDKNKVDNVRIQKPGNDAFRGL